MAGGQTCLRNGNEMFRWQPQRCELVNKASNRASLRTSDGSEIVRLYAGVKFSSPFPFLEACPGDMNDTTFAGKCYPMQL